MQSSPVQNWWICFGAILSISGCVSPAQKLNQESRDDFQAATAYCDQLLVDIAIQPLFEKTPKTISSSVPFSMLTNENLVSDAEKPLITIWADKLNLCQDRLMSGARKYSNPLLVADRQSYYAAVNALRADLFGGRVTWAQFNRTRQKFYIDSQKSSAEITSALARQDERAALARQQAAASEYANFLQAQRNAILQQPTAPVVPASLRCTSQAIGGGIVTTNCN